MVEHARAVIIGGGVGGTSIAYHLTELGWTDIVLVDRAELTSGSTFHSAGLVGQLRELGDADQDDDVRRRAVPPAGGGDRDRPVVARGRLAAARVDARSGSRSCADRPAGRRRSACRSSSSRRRRRRTASRSCRPTACSAPSGCRPTAGWIRRVWPTRWLPAPGSAAPGSGRRPGSSRSARIAAG